MNGYPHPPDKHRPKTFVSLGVLVFTSLAVGGSFLKAWYAYTAFDFEAYFFIFKMALYTSFLLLPVGIVFGINGARRETFRRTLAILCTVANGILWVLCVTLFFVLKMY